MMEDEQFTNEKKRIGEVEDEKSSEQNTNSSINGSLSKGLEYAEKQVTEIKDLGSKLDGEVMLRGWVHRQRNSASKSFVVVRDGTGIVQCVITKGEVSDEAWEDAIKVYMDSVVYVIGQAKKDDRAPGGMEVAVSDFKMTFKGEPFPIGKDQSTEFLLDIRHLSIRSQRILNAIKFKSYLMDETREFLKKREFIEIQPPMMSRSACEGGSTLFEVDYFGKPAYLSQSGQLYSEAFIASYPKVFVFAPAFRAEPSRTPRHLTEFWQMEPEMAFYDQEMNMKLQEEMIEYVCHALAEKHADLLKEFGRDPQDLLDIKAPFKRLTYEQAIKVLQDKGVTIKWGDGIGLDEEKILTNDLKQPIFLTNMPKEMRAFYMKIDPKDPRTVLDADLLAPEGIGEIIGGSERVADYDELVSRMKEQNLNPDDYAWYLDLRKYGSVPHSGFGMGSERVVRWMLKLDSIRDAIPFPRTMNRVTP